MTATPSATAPATVPATTVPAASAPTVPVTTASYTASQNMCAAPRSGIDPYTGKAYLDKQGKLSDEFTFLRGWIDQYYLWYKEVPNVNPLNYSTALDYFITAVHA